MTEQESEPRPGEPLAICTIVSKNYLAYARVLAESIRQHHPDSHFFVLLVDRVDGCFDPRAEPFTLVEIAQLPIPDVDRFCFQYTVLELNTAAKPYFLAYLFEKYGISKLVYLDPDVMVFHDLHALAGLLDQHNIVLTPHMLAPLDDERHPNEIDILKSGAYNLGFIAVANTPETGRFLNWWQRRLYTNCQANFARGLFVDQKWIDLVPGCFDGVHVLRDPGYNVAYWNLHERSVAVRDGQSFVNDGPCYFYHFSGYNPNDPLRVSKYQERFTMADVGDAQFLFEKYGERLSAHGYETTRRWPYAFGSFDNGVKLPDLVRRIYLKLGAEAVRFGNPFAAEGPHSFFHWLTGFGDRKLPPLLQEIHDTYPDLMQVFPQAAGKHRWPFLRWAVREVKARLPMDDAFLEDVRAAVTTKDQRRARRAPLTMRPSAAARPFGVNLSGYFQSEKGVGEAARATIRALDAAGIPYVLNNVTDGGSANVHTDLPAFTDANPYAVNVVQVSIDQVPAFHQARPEYFEGRHNVACWNWELASFPAEWMESFRPFDEVWVPSTFTLASVAAASPVPVRWLPFAVADAPTKAPFGRERFGLPARAFVFLFVFDFHSFLARKNPLATVEAFQRAFGDRGDVLLVLKAAHAKDTPEAFAEVQAACQGKANVRLIEEVLSRDELEGLMMLCDAYVSLHRAEGYGLTLLEAMRLGKPVVATGYSANEDFMNAENSLPVRYNLVEIDRDHGPYHRGCVWAEPDVDHAAEQMRRVVEDRALARRLGEQARVDVQRELNARHVGELLHERLVSLMERPLTHDRAALRSAQVIDPLQELRDANLRLEDAQPTLVRRVLNAAKKMVRHLMPPVLDRQAVYNAMVFDAVTRLAQRVEQQQREVTEMTRLAVQQRFRSRQAG